MKNIVVFGELPIATKIAQFIDTLEDATVLCVVCENYNAKNADPWHDVPMLFDYARNKDIPILRLKDLKSYCMKKRIVPEVGVTARFSKILKSEHLEVFQYGVINLHGGLLPEFGGLNSVNHMLLSGMDIGGGSIHWIDLGIDTGALIKRCTVGIEEDDTALTLHHKVQRALLNGIREVILDGIKVGFPNIKCDMKPENAVSNYYTRDSLDGLKNIAPAELFSEKALRTIRAFDFPGYEPAYTFINGKKIELRYGG